MNARIDAERILDAFLAPESDRLPDRVLDAAFADIARTPQRRALRVPWRFPLMTNTMRAAAGIAIVAIVGVGILAFNSRSPVPGSTNSPAPTSAPTAAPTPEPTAEPSFVAPGITGWKTYTSAVYDYTISYPEDWVVADRATRKWQPGDSEEAPSLDVFFNNAPGTGRDDSMVFEALQLPAPDGADLSSWDGLLAALTELCTKPTEFFREHCPGEDSVTGMCLGTDCQPVAFVLEDGFPRAMFGNPDTGVLTYIWVARVDDFPGAARYGGTVMLLKSILSQLGVREPLPGETPN